MLNKADAADPFVIERLRQREPHHVVVSARTGAGLEAAGRISAAAAAARRELEVLIPYNRGDLRQPARTATARS